MGSRPYVYLDTSVILAILFDDDGAAASLEAFSSFENGDAYCVVSPLVIAELFGCPRVRTSNPGGVPKPEALRRARVRLGELSEQLGRMEAWETFLLVENTRRQAYLVQSLGLDHQLKGPDGLHLATAIDAQCDRLFTFDGGLLKAGSERGIVIQRPTSLKASHSGEDMASPPLDLWSEEFSATND